MHYLADTPDGAWAEFLRHEGITRLEELRGIDRAIWAVEIPDDLVAATPEPESPLEILTGGLQSYDACRLEARRLRQGGTEGLRALSAALVPGGAQGWRVAGGLQPAPPRDGHVITLFGPRPYLIGWRVVESGRPGPDLLPRTRPLAP